MIAGQPGEGVIGRIGATSVGSRFSTLNVATASSSVPAGAATSGASVEGARVNGALGTTSKLPKL